MLTGGAAAGVFAVGGSFCTMVASFTEGLVKRTVVIVVVVAVVIAVAGFTTAVAAVLGEAANGNEAEGEGTPPIGFTTAFPIGSDNAFADEGPP